jgi:UDP-N-acetylmuramyl pentapeptide phosphotransferase/UDP-N-acetylglucosamine-1-phosphate transferase
MLIFLADFRFTHLHGFMGINELNIFASVTLTLFVMIVFINAFNLMDGIDGLASGLSILATSVFGIWFSLAGHTELTVLAFSLTGGLVGFFFYNVFGSKNKIFMGDTGSLILGTVMSVLVIKFNEVNIDQSHAMAIASAPAVSFGIIIYPLFDTIRVFSIRILQKRSPFSPDKNHIHHRLLALGMSHKRATFTILITNTLFLIPLFLLQGIGIGSLMVFNILVVSVIVITIAVVLRKKKLIRKDDIHQQILLPGNNKKLVEPVFVNRKEEAKSFWKKPVDYMVNQMEKMNIW